ncbi:MAG: peptidylprolyl isomerase [Faecousia sp.]
MSASSKKKLRNEQQAAKMTEKQLAEQKEARKLKLYTIIFAAVLAVMLVVAICVGVTRAVSNSGIRERNTTALTVGDHKISNAELSYFYMSAINNFSSNYGSYAAMFGLDTTTPLNEQVLDEETGKTWADDFLDSAKENARAVYALADAAEAAGFTLSEEELSEIDISVNNMKAYATLYGYSSVKDFLKAQYGSGATVESYTEYVKLNTLANSYYSHYADSLTYEDSDLRAAEAENYAKYSSFTYNTYYLSASKFLEGGTTDENGTTTYTDEEKAASVKAAEEAANSLIGEEVASVEDFDAAIAALDVNKDTEASSTAYTDQLYSSVSTSLSDWVTDDARAEGDKTVIANTSTSTDGDGKETTTTNGYYAVFFTGVNDNTFPLVNVRHILVKFAGGTTDSTTGTTTYSDEEKAAAKTAAEEILDEWMAGDSTEESFAALANEKSDDGDGTTGGLYENVYPGQMVASFNDWCFDANRKSGNTGIIESEYGYHVMYFVGNSDYTYRDYQIENELRSADVQQWYDTTVEALTMTDGSTKYIRKDLVLSGN